VYAVCYVDEAYSESDLVCMTNQGKLFVFSLPHLRRQLCTDSVISADIARCCTSVFYLLNKNGAVTCSYSALGIVLKCPVICTYILKFSCIFTIFFKNIILLILLMSK